MSQPSPEERRIIIAGASARAAAWSALRAGLEPAACDLFADRDLRLAAPALRLRRAEYPGRIPERLQAFPPWPVLYTGGLENHPEVVERIAARHPVLGNPPAALRQARDPARLQEVLSAAGLPSLAVRFAWPEPGSGGRWLLKPLRGSGGAGIREVASGETLLRGPFPPGACLQERAPGMPAAAVFLAAPGRTSLAGASLQLAGTSWLGAPPFAYAGSIAPLPLEPETAEAVAACGAAIAGAFALEGLFGLDLAIDSGRVHVVEVNPRYPASAEVLEHALGIPLLQLHLAALRGRALPDGGSPPGLPPPPHFAGGVTGKAILWAREAVRARVPWSRPRPAAPWELPELADVPDWDEPVAAGKPVLTVFARAGTVEHCLERLEARAREARRFLAPASRRLPGPSRPRR